MIANASVRVYLHRGPHRSRTLSLSNILIDPSRIRDMHFTMRYFGVRMSGGVEKISIPVLCENWIIAVGSSFIYPEHYSCRFSSADIPMR
ncbi:MAG: hypothetical protein JWQ98_3704 [Chlorobi bacterium]|nr:hypothetical protein [Chlorobiota bacterium]